MDQAEAREAAQAELDRLAETAYGEPLQLIDDAYVADVGWAWVYAWNTARYYRTRDAADAAGPGAGPVVVVKESGETFPLRSSPSFDRQLADYAGAHGLPEPAPLGW